MKTRILLLAMFVFPFFIGCGGGDTKDDSITFDKTANTAVAALGTVDYTISGLTDTQAYRITLVVDANVTAGTSGTGTFKDGDNNGAADAGASEKIALITMVNGEAVANGGAKTVPGGSDDPTKPSGIFPKDGKITLTIKGVAAGKVHPVVYHNGGKSTFLEIDSSGKPSETYGIGGSVEVTGGASGFDITPKEDQKVAALGAVTYTIGGLTDTQAYRITLVVAANVTTTGDGKGTFKDGDNNGAADAGASEKIALITMANGTAVAGEGAKTIPGGSDDPTKPSGIFPKDGKITIAIKGVAIGTVYPVVYHNGGKSTFLEINDKGEPTETDFVAKSVTVE